MNFIDDGPKRWVCPSDRELTLRAKLRAGWSSRANADLFSGPTPAGSLGAATQSQPASSIQATSINEAEQATIAQVLKRANKLQELEDQRVSKLQQQLDRIKRQARGNGRTSCILCNDQPRFFAKFNTCKDCHNAVCGKCCMDAYELNSAEPIWLCKICCESREVIKKTNLWTKLG